MHTDEVETDVTLVRRLLAGLAGLGLAIKLWVAPS
jgi:hypothetical protein